MNKRILEALITNNQKFGEVFKVKDEYLSVKPTQNGHVICYGKWPLLSTCVNLDEIAIIGYAEKSEYLDNEDAYKFIGFTVMDNFHDIYCSRLLPSINILKQMISNPDLEEIQEICLKTFGGPIK